MIKIGDFAKIFDVSTKTIRHYEKVGLLVPAQVDIYSGYRYFDEENVKRMNEILALKNLGFSLEEIKYFSDEKIKSKIKDYKNEILDINKKILSLQELSFNERKVLDMAFVNDKAVVGKWKLLGVSSDMDNAKIENYMEDDYDIKELYFLPNGRKYWVISWTKGIVTIGKTQNKYEIIDDKMYITIKDSFDQNDSKVVVYEKVDNKEYTEDEITIKDDINLPFVPDNRLIGFWKSVDFIFNENSFNPNKIYWTKGLFLEQIVVSPDNDVMISYENGNAKKSGYTKGYIYNVCADDTLCKYNYQVIDGKEYIVVEWKSGDYVFGGLVKGYYVLEKIK